MKTTYKIKKKNFPQPENLTTTASFPSITCKSKTKVHNKIIEFLGKNDNEKQYMWIL